MHRSLKCADRLITLAASTRCNPAAKDLLREAAMWIRQSTREVAAHTETLTFGKYQGYKVEDIVELNPAYVIWLNEKIDHVRVNPELVKIAAFLVRNRTPQRG